MHFRTAAYLAVAACATNVAAEPQPYKLAMKPVLGMSLVRRDTGGYQPEQTVCGAGDTCSEACGGGYTECAAKDTSIHCFNPDAGQACCNDGSGNSCDDGYFCTHDTKMETWCCPDGMSLEECANKYNVKGGLETPSTTSATPTSTSATSTTSSTTSTPETHIKDTMTSTTHAITTVPCPSSGSSTAWSGSNSTIAATTAKPTQPLPTTGTVILPTPTGPAVPTQTGAAGANSVSALVLLAAGLVAFF